METKLCVIGNISQDSVRFSGEKGWSKPVLGGAALNIALAHGYWGGRPSINAHIGPNVRCALQYEALINFDGCELSDIPSPEFFLEYDEELNLRRLNSRPSDLKDLKLSNISARPNKGDLVHLSLRKPYGGDDLAQLIDAGFRVSVDVIVSSVKEISESLKTFLHGIEILFCNTSELEILRQTTRFEELRHVIVTAGSAPIEIWCFGKFQAAYPVVPVAVVDPTGAGDSFVGAYLRGHLAGLSERGSVELGLAAARLAVAGFGLSKLLPSGSRA